ncbi:hypothetical protein KFK09_006465 [Dendrobium nobile]|uniref:Uncharacterized protein n=1 Tax=Dendrobium nobile TaxID=94219 RepID=A0A8T3BSE2_DENNO|nr:hypothetical protein KFK09_006465 [Dendrobium nobile]
MLTSKQAVTALWVLHNPSKYEINKSLWHCLKHEGGITYRMEIGLGTTSTKKF